MRHRMLTPADIVGLIGLMASIVASYLAHTPILTALLIGIPLTVLVAGLVVEVDYGWSLTVATVGWFATAFLLTYGGLATTVVTAVIISGSTTVLLVGNQLMPKAGYVLAGTMLTMGALLALVGLGLTDIWTVNAASIELIALAILTAVFHTWGFAFSWRSPRVHRPVGTQVHHMRTGVPMDPPASKFATSAHQLGLLTRPRQDGYYVVGNRR